VTDSQASSAQPEKTKPAKATKSSNWPILLLVVILFSLCAAASIYFWQTLNQQNTLISHLNAEKNNHINRLQQLERSTSQHVKAIESRANEQTQFLTKLEKQSIFNTQQLNELGASSRSDWLLAEAEYLMHLANQRLTLEHDFKGAEAILMTADKVLAENDDPGLLPVRQALAAEILSLQQVTDFDHDGMFVRLAAMISSLDKLNESAYFGVSTEQTPSPTPAVPTAEQASDKPRWQHAWNSIWLDLKKALVIRRLDQPVEPLLAPEQNYYLKQNLRLMFEQASLALLDQNTLIFQSSLDKASLWLSHYFDAKSDQVAALASSINELKNQKIEQATPDISNSLRLLKTKIEAMYQNHRLGKLSTQPIKTGDSNSSEGPK